METYSLPEHAAVQHILSSPLIARRTAPYVLDGDFDWRGLALEAQTMSGGERLLVQIAHELWNAEKTIGLWEIPRRLDSHSFRRVIEALQISRGDSAFDVLKAMRDRDELAA